jgi:hypothetical protein
MELYEHQKRIIQLDPRYAPIALGTGGGKTRVCLELAQGSILVICPKQQKLDRTWEINAEKFGIHVELRVVSKEEFRKIWMDLPRFDTIIGDEFHYMLGVYPDEKYVKKVRVPKTSQMYEAIRGYMDKHKPSRFYPASATMISKPMNLYALGVLLGKSWDYHKFRDRFYFEKKIGFRSLWIPRRDSATKDLLVKLFKDKLGAFTGTLSDWFDVPDQVHKTVYVPLTAGQHHAIRKLEEEEADPMAKRARIRTIENGILYATEVDVINEKESRLSRRTIRYDSDKLGEILDLVDEFPKILIFAAYTGQVESIAEAVGKAGLSVYTLTGATKNREEVVRKAEESEAAVVIAQASISSGYELPSFPCVVFASKSFLYRDYEQGLGRVLRANAIKKNLYVHIVVKGGLDEQCHKTIMAGEDFQEQMMSNV